MNTLARLQTWYSRQCNGEWENSHGITIQTCDNPGWWVKINLAGTPLRKQPFAGVTEGVDAQRYPVSSSWLSCYMEDGTWHGAGNEARLEQILEVFLTWAETHGS
jgi:hypothetical protein